ncbi:MAG: glucose-1-phosphate adenylyltransferase [Bacteroidales bacterium]
MKKKVIAIILGGGQGSRLQPLTTHRSKPAVPVGGKYRLVDIPISNCLNSGIDRMFLLTQFNSASLNKHVSQTYRFDSFSDAFVDILAAEQTPENQGWFQGTADAVRQSLHHVNNYEYDYVLILSGDQLYHMNYCDMLNAHIENGAEISLSTLPVTAKGAHGFGIMKTENNRIKTFIEKPAESELEGWESEVSEEMKATGRIYLASMGIYVFNRDCLNSMLKDNESYKDFGKEIIPIAIEEGKKVTCYEFSGYWEDIGTIDSFYQANIELTEVVPKFDLFDSNFPIYTRVRMLPSAKISGSTTIKSSLISDGCIVDAKSISDSILGVRSRVGAGTRIEKSYIMGNENFQTIEEIEAIISRGNIPFGIGQDCNISGAIIDFDVMIGNRVTVAGGSHLEDEDHELYAVRGGVVVIKKGVKVSDGSVIPFPKFT